ncbi:hypothetical protein F2Q70_00030769 [Brassica cretica]|uniref:Uncharacterized protein n=2 Tax=Brassica cretica TaxID=69181 RepID=A0A8S9GXH3_BRACR|nr:hypothetical protein F2Q70_00030769 [Brassica cretica]KAF2551105.1 hypothetical protein F2Q68_00035164 [Brassica cretica]KAF3596591.1 hypothetical protein DY000_02023427 [Brassica cretica]
MDLIVAVISLMIGLGFFALIAAVLCSVAFFHHVKSYFLTIKKANLFQTKIESLRERRRSFSLI